MQGFQTAYMSDVIHQCELLHLSENRAVITFSSDSTLLWWLERKMHKVPNLC